MAGVPDIDVEEALRLLAEEQGSDNGLETPRDMFAEFKSIREMWDEAKQRELHGTVHEQAAQLGYATGVPLCVCSTSHVRTPSHVPALVPPQVLV